MILRCTITIAELLPTSSDENKMPATCGLWYSTNNLFFHPSVSTQTKENKLVYLNETIQEI